MTPFLPDLALQLLLVSFDAIPIPCSILPGTCCKVWVSTLQPHHRVPTWFSERASPGRHRATHGRLQTKRTCASRDLCQHGINVGLRLL
jgi:hypothetical protein